MNLPYSKFLLYMCPHTTVGCYVCVRIPLYTAIYVSVYYCTQLQSCPHTTAYCCICVRIPLYTEPLNSTPRKGGVEKSTLRKSLYWTSLICRTRKFRTPQRKGRSEKSNFRRLYTEPRSFAGLINSTPRKRGVGAKRALFASGAKRALFARQRWRWRSWAGVGETVNKRCRDSGRLLRL